MLIKKIIWVTAIVKYSMTTLKAQQIWDILQGASSLGVKFTRKILSWYGK